MNPISKIAIVMAMRAESQPLIDAMGFKNITLNHNEHLPTLGYHASREGQELYLIVHGKDSRYGVDSVGTQPATIAALLAVQQFDPDLLINAGTAGSFGAKGGKIADVYLSAEKVVFHDRRIMLPGFFEYGIGNYPCVKADRMAKDLGLQTGIISTGNSLDMLKKDLQFMIPNNAMLKEMEAAAIAYVASLFGVPFLGVKSITDLVDNDEDDEEEFVENLAAASSALCTAMIKILEYLKGKSIEDLA
jgi:nucleoside phosphorylase